MYDGLLVLQKNYKGVLWGEKLKLTPRDYQELKFTGNIELIWKSK